jgi:predicted nucleic acid-binding Zn ribbon protein
MTKMVFPIKICAVCSEEFELKPDKPGFANRCPACSEPEPVDSKPKQGLDADERKALMEANEARRRAMRDLLYRKDS